MPLLNLTIVQEDGESCPIQVRFSKFRVSLRQNSAQSSPLHPKLPVAILRAAAIEPARGGARMQGEVA